MASSPHPTGSPSAHVLLMQARGAQRLGQKEQAYALLKRAHESDRRDPEILHALGMATGELRTRTEAIGLLRRAVAARPKHAPWQWDLAEALMVGARTAQALQVAQRAMQLDPNNAAGHVFLAQLLHMLRRSEDAAQEARRALELSPGLEDASLVLARIHISAGEPEQAEPILRSMADSASPMVRYTALHLLGDVLDRAGSYDEAFAMHDRANRGVLTLAQTRAMARMGRVDRAEEYLGEGASEVYGRWGARRFDDGLPTPVFLVGFVRSGTTMTEQIMRSHPRMTSTDERNFTEIVFHRAMELAATAGSGSPGLLRGLDALTGAQVSALRRMYWDLVSAEVGAEHASKRIVDKNPLNILDAGFIARLFPDAPIVVMLRDPRDCCLSALFQAFTLNAGTVQMLDVEDVGRYYARVMRFWLDIRGLIRNPILEIRYEDLVHDFDTHARRLIEFVGLEWSDEVARFHEKAAKHAVFSASYLSVTKKINSRAVGRWSHYERHLSPLMEHVRPFIDAFGYEA